MKTFALILGLVLLALPALAGDHPSSADHPLATASGWFDLENCEFCKNLLSDPELLELSGRFVYAIYVLDCTGSGK